MDERLIIILVGLYSSGKDTVAEYFKQRGFGHISLSDILRDYCRKYRQYRGRDDLIHTGNKLRKRYGCSYLALQGLKKASQQGLDRVVFSSVRNPSEAKEFKKYFHTYIINIAAPLRVRYQRARARGKIDDQVIFSRFKTQELNERKGSTHQQQLDKVIAMADFKIINSGTLKELYAKIDKVMIKISNKVKIKKVFNIVILGPQGSGKGTQAEKLAEHFGLAHIETGKLFRIIARQKTPLGRKINLLINKQGKLVPAPVVIRILQQKLKELSKGKGIVFDGYPRNSVQAKALDKILQSIGRHLTHVIYLPISKRTTIKRLSLRRTCSVCGRVFIAGKTIASRARTCPRCKGAVFQRKDDRPEAIAKRLEIFNSQTKPLIRYYKNKGILMTVNGEPPVPLVTKQVLKVIE